MDSGDSNTAPIADGPNSPEAARAFAQPARAAKAFAQLARAFAQLAKAFAQPARAAKEEET